MKRWLLFLFLFFLGGQLASAVGIGPARVELVFEPNNVVTLDFVVLNTGDSPIDVLVDARGELASFVSFDQNRFHLSGGEAKDFAVTLRMPAHIDTPGSNVIRIVALETNAGQGGTVGAVAGVEAKIDIFVPYEGAFIRANLRAPNIAVGENLPVTLTVENIGKENIAALTGRFEVSRNGDTLVREAFEPVVLDAQEKKEIAHELKTSGLPAGLYNLTAVVEYAGQTKTVVRSVGIGGMFVDIMGLVEDTFAPGEIVKLEFKTMSSWSEELSGVADVRIFEGEKEVVALKSASVLFSPWKESIVEVFWDARTAPAGAYVARIDLSYGDGKHTLKDFNFFLEKKGAFFPFAAASALIVVLIIFVGWGLWRRRTSPLSLS